VIRHIEEESFSAFLPDHVNLRHGRSSITTPQIDTTHQQFRRYIIFWIVDKIKERLVRINVYDFVSGIERIHYLQGCETV
jgi:hypothetical protein